jgi:hypothetical protein
MNPKRYIIGLGLALSLPALSACDKFLDVNDNPNNPVVSTPNFLLPGIISNGIQTQMFTALRTPYITQYVVVRSTVGNALGIDQYYFTNAQSTNTFNYSYFQAGGNIPTLQKAAEAEGSVYYIGAGKIMQALILAHATDMLGDIPYSEAYQGGANFTPKYDPQEKIYATVNQLCDEGVVEMNKPASAQVRPFYSTAPSESGDILYKGDPAKWVRLAYALKARQAQHLTKKTIYDPNAVLALCAKAFQSSADDAQINFQTAVAPLAGTTNIFGVTRANFGSATFSTNIIRYLNGTTFPGVVDPRFGILTPTTSLGVVPGGVTAASANLTPGTTNITDVYGSWYARDLGYFEAITYHELKFIEAEAAYRAGDKAKALASLREGIRAHMTKVGAGGTYSAPLVTFPVILPGQITAYLNSAAVPQDPNDPKLLRSIMEQKYIAMFLNPESWSDMRRYDFSKDIYVNLQFPTYGSGTTPPLPLGPNGEKLYPRRLLPGATEVTVNPNAVAGLYTEAGLAIGTSAADQAYVTKPLWFDRP